MVFIHISDIATIAWEIVLTSYRPSKKMQLPKGISEISKMLK